MHNHNRMLTLLISTLAAVSILAACGGGGSTSSVINGGGGGGDHASPSPMATAALSGTAQVATGGTFAGGYTYTLAPSGDEVVFSCGCSSQAGLGGTIANGAFTLVQNSTATPATPTPTYTIVPGRNYVIITQPASGNGPQAWTIQFAGKVPGRNLYLNAVSNASDVFTAAVSLYVFQQSSSSATAFDDWNFFNLQTWYNQLKSSPNFQETMLLNDIASQSALSATLYPNHPGWNAAQPTSSPIKADITAVVTSGDPVLPSPCPTDAMGNALCTGSTPSP